MQNSSTQSDRLRFPKQVKASGWRVTRDEIGDEKILLIKGGDGDHIYPFSSQRFGVWVSRAKISRLVDKLKKTEGCVIEQLGDHEAVVSFPYDKFDEVAKLLHAARKKNLSPKLRDHLNNISTFTDCKLHVQGANKRVESPKQCDCVLFAGHVLLALATGSCEPKAEGKAWKLVEVLLNSYAIRRAGK